MKLNFINGRVINSFLVFVILTLTSCNSGPEFSSQTLKNSSADATQVASVLTSIEIGPALPSVSAGLTLSMIATGKFSDGTSRDLSQEVLWQSADPTIAEVGSDPTIKGLIAGLTLGQTVISASYESMRAEAPLTVTDAALVSLELDLGTNTITFGGTHSYVITALFSDGTKRVVTELSQWESSNPEIAVIESAGPKIGQVSARGVGITTIKVTYGSLTASTVLTVKELTMMSLVISPASPTVFVGREQAFIATAKYEDGSEANVSQSASWRVGNPDLATIGQGAQGGIATGRSPGTTEITASLDGVEGKAMINVKAPTLSSIEVTPSDVTIASGLNQAFSARGKFDDGSESDITGSVNWTATDPKVASIGVANSPLGLATGLIPGSTSITANLFGVSGESKLTVTPATLKSISITPKPAVVTVGARLQFTATGLFTDHSTSDLTQNAIWSSSVASTASISNAPETSGLVSGLAIGTTSISATVGSISDSTNLKVDEAPNAPPKFTSTPITTAKAGDPIGTTSALDLTKWSVVNYKADNPANWQQFSTRAVQTRNAGPSILLSNMELSQKRVEGKFKVTSTDDDYIGFVFGYQNQNKFYIFSWKGRDQDNLKVGMTVRLVQTPDQPTFADFTNPSTDRVKTLYSNSVPWNPNTVYHFILSYIPGDTTITIKQEQTTLATIKLTDKTLTRGLFGFYNLSQDNVTYEGFVQTPVAGIDYEYQVTATDPDNDVLSYSLSTKPEGMTINPKTGKITWPKTSFTPGSHPVSVIVDDGQGHLVEQKFVIQVVL